MTLPSWDFMQMEDRVRMTVQLFPTLEQEVALATIREWAKNEYPSGWHGEQEAIADLIKMLKEAVLSPEQKAKEKSRVKRLVEEEMKWQFKQPPAQE